MKRIWLGSIILTAGAFAAAGSLSRYMLRTTETRWQIAAFVGAAAYLEVAAAARRPGTPSWLRGLTNATAATFAILLMKFHLEPIAKARDAASVQHVARTVTSDIRKAL